MPREYTEPSDKAYSEGSGARVKETNNRALAKLRSELAGLEEQYRDNPDNDTLNQQISSLKTRIEAIENDSPKEW